MKLMVHNHEVEGDGDALRALHELDARESERLFDYAMHNHEAHFEADVHGKTESFVLVRDHDGKYRLEFEGKVHEKHTGWF